MPKTRTHEDFNQKERTDPNKEANGTEQNDKHLTHNVVYF